MCVALVQSFLTSSPDFWAPVEGRGEEGQELTDVELASVAQLARKEAGIESTIPHILLCGSKVVGWLETWAVYVSGATQQCLLR